MAKAMDSNLYHKHPTECVRLSGWWCYSETWRVINKFPLKLTWRMLVVFVRWRYTGDITWVIIHKTKTMLWQFQQERESISTYLFWTLFKKIQIVSMASLINIHLAYQDFTSLLIVMVSRPTLGLKGLKQGKLISLPLFMIPHGLSSTSTISCHSMSYIYISLDFL